MTGGLDRLNRLPRTDAIAELLACCGAQRWAERMADARPFASSQQLFETADACWRELEEADWRQAFATHPRIGERAVASADVRHAIWSEQEQAGALTAAADTRAELAELNRAYEQRFGHVFLICATGRSADEMLAELRRRLHHDPAAELRTAAEEQRRITRIRLEKLL